MKLTDKKIIIFFEIVCCFLYLASYVNRYSYGSMISVISDSLDVPGRIAGLVTSGLFISYGAGQLVSGRLGDRFKPYRLVLIGITAVSVINIVMSFMSNIWVMLVLWVINGFFQSMLWPPLVRFMTDMLRTRDYAKAVVIVSIGSQCGNILVYLCIPLCLAVGGWRFGFIACSVVGFAAALIWLICISRIIKKSGYVFRPTVGAAAKKTASGDEAKPLGPIIVSSGLVTLFIAIIFQGTLRDGVQTWMPEFISEYFGIAIENSILFSVSLPIFAVICYWLAAAIQEKVRNEVKTATIIFAFGAICGVLLNLVSGTNRVATVICMALMTGSMHGVNLMLISRVPQRYAKYGKVSTVSGIVNSFTYVGSAASTYVFPLFSSLKGWDIMPMVWMCIAAAGTLFCLLSLKRWKNFIS